MKIGILTLPLHTNYGGILQAYALQTVLERMGHDVVVFDKPMHTDVPPLLKRIRIYLRRIKGKILGNYKGVILYSTAKKNIEKERKYTQKFINKHIKRLEIKQLHEINGIDLDAIVVGSDQIWRERYFKWFWSNKICDAFLDFCNKEIIRISYAASFGTDKWEYTKEETLECANAIRKFSYVSTREFSGVQLCREKLSVNGCLQVLDPTFLLSKEDYIKVFNSAGIPKSPGNLLLYILDEDEYKKNIINNVLQMTNMVPFRVNSYVEDNSVSIEKRCQPPVEKWIRGFYDAKYVVTDSFHACVFSIIFNKPFVVVANPQRGLDRIISLLNIFGLKNCLYKNGNEVQFENDYNWNKINEILRYEVYKSMSFLRNSMTKN